jgi:hypothetical protein
VIQFSQLLFLLVCAHALADYPLQGPFLSEAKNRNTALGKLFWPHALFAHSMIHGGFVYMLTGSLWMACAEVVIHGVTDWLKCENRISLNTDQAIHIACKVLWALLAAWGLA